MRTTELKDILKTIEAIRAQDYPELDKSFLEAVVIAEDENPDDEGEAIRSIESALQSVLKVKVKGGR